ncbi:MAG: hypothetical protein WAU43_18480, partial [Acidobacteriaceae bacterium]
MQARIFYTHPAQFCKFDLHDRTFLLQMKLSRDCYRHPLRTGESFPAASPLATMGSVALRDPPVMVKRLSVCIFALLLSISTCIPCSASAYDAHPKLVVILVIDQFREDYLERYRADFKGNGFDLFLDRGAYFPDCYYDYAN